MDAELELPPDIRMVVNGEAHIAYRLVGPTYPSAPTVCLIASTGRGPEDFYHLAEYLGQQGIRVAMPWPRGMGASHGPMADVDFHDLASDAAVVLAAERGEGPAVAVGHAYGCWIARTMAQDHPELVDGLVLLSAGGGTWPPELSRAIDVVANPNQPEAERLAGLQLAFFAYGNDPRPWLSGWNADVIAMQRAARSLTVKESWAPSGAAPILDIVGTVDPFRPEEARDYYVNLFAPRALLKLVEGTSHAMPDEDPQAVAEHMVPWIRQLETRLR